MTQSDESDIAFKMRLARLRRPLELRRRAAEADQRRVEQPVAFQPAGAQILGRTKPLEQCRRGQHDPFQLGEQRFCRWCGELAGS